MRKFLLSAFLLAGCGRGLAIPPPELPDMTERADLGELPDLAKPDATCERVCAGGRCTDPCAPDMEPDAAKNKCADVGEVCASGATCCAGAVILHCCSDGLCQVDCP